MGSWERLYGGFWQKISGQDRRRNIRISNEPVVELDYGQTAIRLLYGMEKQALPPGDLYEIPGFERYRDGIKLVINAALGNDERTDRMPRGGRKDIPYAIKYRDIIREEQPTTVTLHIGSFRASG